MPTETYRAYCFSCRKKVTLSNYKIVVKTGKVDKTKKTRFAVGPCPKCKGKVYRIVASKATGSRSKSKTSSRAKSGTKKPKKRTVSRAK